MGDGSRWELTESRIGREGLELVPKQFHLTPGCAKKSGSGWAVEICGSISGCWYTPKWAGASGTRYFLI